MSRTPTEIIQIPSPTDGALKRFVEAIVHEQIVKTINVYSNPHQFVTINVEAFHAKPEKEPAIEKDEDGNEVVSEEVASWRSGLLAEVGLRDAFSASSETSAIIPKVTFGSIVFERVKTELVSRGTNTPFYLATASSKVSEFTFKGVNQQTDYLGRFTALITEHLQPTSLPPGLVADEGPFAELFTRLTSVTAGIADTLSKTQLEQQKRMDELLVQQEELHKKRMAEVEAFSAAEKERLDAIQKSLNDREDKLDNASARDTRRSLRGNITENIKIRQTEEIIPKTARILRIPIYLIGFAGISASILLSMWSFQQLGILAPVPDETGDLSQATMSPWVLGSLLLRGALGILAATGIGLYMLNYLRKIESDAGERAQSLERYLFDIDRASWVIETVLEMGEEENGISSVPDAWMGGVTKNLFEQNQAQENIDGPVEALTKLMASGAAIKVGNGEASIECAPKASQKAAKAQKK